MEPEVPESSPGDRGSWNRLGECSQGGSICSKEKEVLSRLSELERNVSSIREQLATPTKSGGERSIFGSVQKGEMVDRRAKDADLYGKVPRLVEVKQNRDRDKRPRDERKQLKLRMPINLSKQSCVPAEVVLNDFERSRAGERTAVKDLDNAHQARSHAKRFCLYMHADQPSAARAQDLSRLYQVDKIRSYVALRSAIDPPVVRDPKRA